MSLRDQLFQNSSLAFENNVFYQKDLSRSTEFERRYLKIREKENRLYDDGTVLTLPNISASHPLKKEWDIRKASSRKLIDFLSRRESEKVLEVGCGNGWLSNILSQIKGSEVIGLDINQQELQQGARVFEQNSMLSFMYGDVFTVDINLKFDSIILASSLQYFTDLEKVLIRLFNLLEPNGQVHIIDTPFYNSEGINAARKRTLQYFKQFGESSHPYHHHSWDALLKYNIEIIYDPRSFSSKFKRIFVKNSSPFPWVIIKK